MPLQILLSEVFPKEQSKWFVILVAGLRIISSRPRHSEQVCSIVLGLLFSFPDKFAQASTWSCCRDAYALYFIDLLCLWDCWLWLALFTVLRSGKDGRYGFKISRKYRRLAFVFSLLVRLIWFCETAKLSNSVLQITKEWPNINYICIDVLGQTTRLEMHFQRCRPFKTKNSFLSQTMVEPRVANKPWNFHFPEVSPLLP